MAGNDTVFTNADVMALLKRYYKDGIESDIYRNSPVLPTIGKQKYSGESYRWAATYASSPTASNDYTVSALMATKSGKNVQWEATPARHFSTLTISQKEIYASSQSEGSFGRILGNKVFLALEGMRKQMPREFYGKGYGELCAYSGATQAATAGATVNLPEYATISLVPGSQIRIIKASTIGTAVPTIAPTLNNPAIVVRSVDDGSIVLDTTSAATSFETGDLVIFDGAIDSGSVFHAPVGLDGWILDRGATDYATSLTTPFFNVVRANAPSALGGQYIINTAGEKKFDTLMRLLRKCRRAGGDPDLIIMNDLDAANAIIEYETIRTQFINQNPGKTASTLKGANSASFVLWTSILDKVIDDPFCTLGKSYMLTKDHCNILHFNNIDKVISDNSGPGEEPGRSNPLADDSANYGVDGDKLIIDDIVSIEDGERSADGPVKLVGFNLFYQYVLFNTASSGVAVLTG